MLAVMITLVIMLTFKRLIKLVKSNPWFFGIDLLISAIIIGISGGLNSPYYLYALSPLLASALFFKLPGALYSSLSYTPIYLLAINLPIQSENTIEFFTKLLGFGSCHLWLEISIR